MSNELKKIVKEIQFKTDKTIEEIANDIGYARAYFTNQINIGTNKNLKKLLQEKYRLNNEQNVLIEPAAEYVTNPREGPVFSIEIKTASGKLVKVIPEGHTDIVLLNAFLEERDRVLEERNRIIEKIEKSKDELLQILNSTLNQITGDTRAALAYQKAWVKYEAERSSGGNKKKENEIRYKMSKLVDDELQSGDESDIPDETHKQHKA